MKNHEWANIKNINPFMISSSAGPLTQAQMPQKTKTQVESLLGDIREEEIPDPIPHSEVKLLIADGTAHKSVGE